MEGGIHLLLDYYQLLRDFVLEFIKYDNLDANITNQANLDLYHHAQ